jgi:endonuclease/exonuclease/phosphatase family metal-dependent hydrolase
MAVGAEPGAGDGPGPGSVRFGTYNVLNLYAADSAEDLRHYELVAAVIRSLDADVLAVQEILAPDAETAARRLRQLAGDVGLRCEVPGPGGPEAAVAFGGHGYHVGLMWRDGIEPVPGSLRCYGGRDFWHGLVLVTLDVGGTLIRHGAFHASPFCRRLRADQNERLVAAITRPRGEPPVLVGADWNTESADRVPAGTLYEPADPYAGVEWFADLIYQCQWDYDEHGRRRHWADREPGDVLWAGGLHDAAAAVGAVWQPTVGHHPADGYGARGVRRRIDAVRVTEALVPALRAHQVIDTAQTRGASDHLPVVVEYAPAAVAAARA